MVCDANDHVKCLPTFLGPVLPLLRPGGDVVLTLKYYGRGPKTGDVAGKMSELLPVRCCCSVWGGARAWEAQTGFEGFVVVAASKTYKFCAGCVLQGLEAGTVLWLLANTLCERTYVTRKK